MGQAMRHIIAPLAPKLYEERATFVVAGGRLYGPASGNASKNYVEAGCFFSTNTPPTSRITSSRKSASSLRKR